jgi:hypothetical protein
LKGAAQQQADQFGPQLSTQPKQAPRRPVCPTQPKQAPLWRPCPTQRRQLRAGGVPDPAQADAALAAVPLKGRLSPESSRQDQRFAALDHECRRVVIPDAWWIFGVSFALLS